jgi:hypothetical protein
VFVAKDLFSTHSRTRVLTQVSFRRAELRDKEPMGLNMSTLTFTTGRFPHRIRFVVVNERVPRSDEHCALCSRIVEKGYVRDSQTRLIYCDTQCFAVGGVHEAAPVVKNRGRKVS